MLLATKYCVLELVLYLILYSQPKLWAKKLRKELGLNKNEFTKIINKIKIDIKKGKKRNEVIIQEIKDNSKEILKVGTHDRTGTIVKMLSAKKTNMSSFVKKKEEVKKPAESHLPQIEKMIKRINFDLIELSVDNTLKYMKDQMINLTKNFRKASVRKFIFI